MTIVIDAVSSIAIVEAALMGPERQDRIISRGVIMDSQEKMWYSIKETIEYLHLPNSDVLSRKMIFLNLESRTLPGMKGQSLSRRDVLLLETHLRHPDWIL